MKKTTIILLLSLIGYGAVAQTQYNLNYDTIRVGKVDQSSGVALYGDIYLKNTVAGLLRLNADRKFVTTTLAESDIPSLPQSKIVGLGDSLTAKINVTEKGAANGVATLNSLGKLNNSQVPAIAISETFVVASEAAMLALSAAEQGDVAVRTDLNKSFILTNSSPGTLASWQELLTPTDAVSSVNGQTGTVTLSASDVGAEPLFSKNTAFNKNFGTTAGTVVEGGTLGSNAYTSTAYLPIASPTFTGVLTGPSGVFGSSLTTNWTADASFARFGHSSYNTSTNYGVLQDASGNVYIQGTGVYIGSTGGNNTTVTNTGITTPAIKLTNGASNGYVLKSDASGNASWQPTTSSYKGTWDASTNTPTIADGTGATGDYYEVATGGTQFGRTFVMGGRAIYNGTIWEPVGVGASVTSVNGYTGTVVLAKNDLSLGNVDNTSDATKNAATATLTNKNISGSTNTITDIGNTSLSAGIDATKLADGSVTNTELQYINTLTSNAQTQIDAKLSTSTASSTYQTIANLSTDLTASATKYPSVNAVNTGLSSYMPKIGGTFTGQVGINVGSSNVSDFDQLFLVNGGENGANMIFNNAFGNLASVTGTKVGAGADADDGVIIFKTATASVLAEKARITNNGLSVTGTGSFTSSLSASNLSGINTGDQTITLTGAVTGSGTGSFATTLASGIDATKLADGSVTNTELQYINSVTSDVQTQLDAKLATATATSTYQTIANLQTDLTASATKYPSINAVNTGLGLKENSVTAGTTAQYYRGDKSWQTLDKTAVGLSNVDNTSDATKNAATATLTNKTLTAPVINSPTGIVKGDVGLGNVDNTSDANKPVSTATQTALDLKANISSLATVATSGDYNDLSNKPSIPAYTTGSWTPTGNGVTFSSASGSYVTIGDMVFATYSVVMPATSNTNGFFVNGLPFAPATADLYGGNISTNNSGYNLNQLVGNASGGYIGFLDNTATATSNADMSARTIKGTVIYKK